MTKMTSKTKAAPTRKKVAQYSDTPSQFVQPNAEELAARNKRNIAIAIGLAAFMAFVFVTMITRSAS